LKFKDKNMDLLNHQIYDENDHPIRNLAALNPQPKVNADGTSTVGPPAHRLPNVEKERLYFEQKLSGSKKEANYASILTSKTSTAKNPI